MDAMHKYVTLTHSMLKNNFTGLIPNPAEGDTFDEYLFGVARAHEYPMSLMWLYENYPRDNGDVIREVIDLMFEGAVAAQRDWNTFFTEGTFPTEAMPIYKVEGGFTHGVNTAEGKPPECDESACTTPDKLRPSVSYRAVQVDKE